MRAEYWMSWLAFLVLAAGQDDVDSEQSRKVLGSSVVTSVSVIMDHGNGTKTYIADAAGQPVTQSEGPVGSPGELLSPDRYEFYTFDESGDLVKRLMTLDQIQGLIAGGDNDAMDSDATAPIYYHENLPTDSNGHMDVTDVEISDVQGVHNVVASVQNVLKSELEASKKKPTLNKPLAVLNMPDAASSWSIILPGVLGAGEGSMATDDDSSELERVNLTEAPSVKESTTTAKATITTTIGTTVVTTTEPSTTIKYVTKRPTDSPTVVHYLPIENIPTKRPIQSVKVSTSHSTLVTEAASTTTPTSDAMPVMDELSASLSSVLAQVSEETNQTADIPVITTETSTTELSRTKAPENYSTTFEKIGNISNVTTPNKNTSANLLERNTTFIGNMTSVSIVNETDLKSSSSTSHSSSIIKSESLEAQSSNVNIPTYEKTVPVISTKPTKGSIEEVITERNKPATTIDETLQEFISTTISGSGTSVKPMQTTYTSTSKPSDIKSTTSNKFNSSMKPVIKNPMQPVTNISSNSTLNPTLSSSTTSDMVSGKNLSTISNQYNSATTTKTDFASSRPLINQTEINITKDNLPSNKTSGLGKKPIITSNSTFKNNSVNTKLGNSSVIIKPIKLETLLFDDRLENKLSGEKSSSFNNAATSLVELVASSLNTTSETSSILSTSNKNNNITILLPNITDRISATNKDKTSSTLIETPKKPEILPFDVINSPTTTASETLKEKPIEVNTGMSNTESTLSAIIIGNTTQPKKSTSENHNTVKEQTNTTNTKPSSAHNIITPDKVKNYNNTDKYNVSESKVVVSKTNNTTVKTSNVSMKPTTLDKVQNSTNNSKNITNYTKPTTPSDVYFTITTNKPSITDAIELSTKIKNDIQYNMKISTLKPTAEVQLQNVTVPNLNSQLSTKPFTMTEKSSIDVKLDSAESQTVVIESLTTLKSVSPTSQISTTVSPNLNSSLALTAMNKTNYDYTIKTSTSSPNTDSTTTETIAFTTTLASDEESTDSMLNMDSDPSVHESISAVTNILLEDKSNEPPNEPQIPLPAILNASTTTSNEPKPVKGELKHALINDEDNKATTEINESSTLYTNEEPTMMPEMYTVTESENKDIHYNTKATSNQSLADESLDALSSSLITTNENKTDEYNSTEYTYEITTHEITTVKDDNPDESYETTATLKSTTLKSGQQVKNESSINRPVMQAIPTKESKLNPDQITEGESSNLNLNVADVVIDENKTITIEEDAQSNISNEYVTPEPVLISSSNDKKENTIFASTTEIISTMTNTDATTSKVDKETVTEKISLKTAIKPGDNKSQLLKKPPSQNAYRPLAEPPLTPPTAVELHPAPHESMGLEASTAFLGDDVRRFSDLCNELAFRMWTSITGKGSITSRSLVFSPFSATSLLAMVFLGARGPTSGQMNDVLRLDDMVTFNPHQVLQNITESVLNSRNYGVATAAFIRELYSDKVKGKILDFYKERAQQYYDGHVEEIAFNVIGDILRRRTNLLVKRQTLGRIPEYLRGSGLNLRPPLAAFSANIFQTDCEQASIDGRDGEMYFVVRPSTRQRRLVPVPAAVWRSGFLAGYEPGLDATAVALGTDTVVSTLLVLPGQQGQVAPGDGLARLEQRLIETSYRRGGWSRLLRSLLPRPGLELQVPRFSHRSVLNVTGALQRMGLKDLFNEGRADLRGLNGLSNELYLSDMVQVNTFSTCGEEAIGARHHVETYPVSPQRMGREEPELYPDFEEEDDSLYMAMPLSLRPRQARLPDNPRLRFDRPFLYMVRHNPTGMILYMGRFNPRLLP